MEFGVRKDNMRGTRSSTFPREWGPPVGDPFIEERAEWVRSNVAEEAHAQRFRHLANVNGRLLSIVRTAYIDSIK